MKTMKDKALSHYLEFLVEECGEDEATVLTRALRAGIEALYREALVAAFLLGRVPREEILRELGPEQLTEIELQRDVLRRDIEWGLRGA